jgi:hypothetical protein
MTSGKAKIECARAKQRGEGREASLSKHAETDRLTWTTHKPMGWVLQGGYVTSCSQWIHHGCPDCLTRLGTMLTQTCRRGTARVLMVTADWGEVNGDLIGFALLALEIPRPKQKMKDEYWIF